MKAFKASRNKWLGRGQLKQILKDGYFRLLDDKKKVFHIIKRSAFDWRPDSSGRNTVYHLDFDVAIPAKRTATITDLVFYHDKFGAIHQTPIGLQINDKDTTYNLHITYRLAL